MSGRIFKIVTALIAATLFTAWPDPLRAEARIETAIRQYRRGLPEDAEYYWLIASRTPDPRFNFELHKLRAMLDLRLARIPEATRSIEAALAVRDDPFLHYLLGHLYLDMRRMPEAAESFRKAAETSRGRPPSDKSFADLLPFSCGEDDPIPAFSSFTSIQAMNGLWVHELSEEESAIAAFTAEALRRRFAETLPLVRMPAVKTGSILGRLLAAPENTATHAACVNQLALREKETAKAAPKKIPALKEKQTAYFRLRFFYFRDEASLELLARHLSYNGRHVEALHVLRAVFFRRLRSLDFQKPDEHDRATSRSLAFVIREIASGYGAIGQNQDRTVLLLVADAMESEGHTSLRVLREAGQKQDNRECLYLLSALQPARRGDLLRRLRQRDEAASDPEFRLVFTPLYAEKGDPP